MKKKSLDLITSLNLIKKYWYVFIILFVLLVGGYAYHKSKQQKKYLVSASFIIKSYKTSEKDYITNDQQEAEIIKSRKIIEKAIKLIPNNTLTADEVKSNLMFAYKFEQDAFKYSFLSSDTTLATQFFYALLNTYQADNIERREQQAIFEINAIETRLKNIDNDQVNIDNVGENISFIIYNSLYHSTLDSTNYVLPICKDYLSKEIEDLIYKYNNDIYSHNDPTNSKESLRNALEQRITGQQTTDLKAKAALKNESSIAQRKIELYKQIDTNYTLLNYMLPIYNIVEYPEDNIRVVTKKDFFIFIIFTFILLGMTFSILTYIDREKK